MNNLIIFFTYFNFSCIFLVNKQSVFIPTYIFRLIILNTKYI